MLRVEYVEAAKGCGAYAMNAHLGTVVFPGQCADHRMAMIDRVKSPADLPTICSGGGGDPAESPGGALAHLPGAGDWKALTRALLDDAPSRGASGNASAAARGVGAAAWDACLRQERLHRVVTLASVETTEWWTRTRNATSLLRAANLAAIAARAATADAATSGGKPVAGWAETASGDGWRLDLFGVQDCLNHVPAPAPPGQPESSSGASALTAAAAARIQAASRRPGK
jgi:hypothetical protein